MMWFSAVMFPGEVPPPGLPDPGLPDPGLPDPGFPVLGFPLLGGGLLDREPPMPMQPVMSKATLVMVKKRIAHANVGRFGKELLPFNALEAAALLWVAD